MDEQDKNTTVMSSVVQKVTQKKRTQAPFRPHGRWFDKIQTCNFGAQVGRFFCRRHASTSTTNDYQIIVIAVIFRVPVVGLNFGNRVGTIILFGRRSDELSTPVQRVVMSTEKAINVGFGVGLGRPHQGRAGVGLGLITVVEIRAKGLRALNQPVAEPGPVGKGMLDDFQASGKENADGFQYIESTLEEAACRGK
jgi:hypothetical protein